MRRYDVVVIGAGIVGLSTARELLLRSPGLRLAVVDKEAGIGRHQTGHNSGVIHSGIYYTPGSLKARLCVQGSRDLYAYCEQKGISFDRCGKVIVAISQAELPRLHTLFERGKANGVEGLELIGPERLGELEPHCAGIQAIWSPDTGIVDFGAVARAYADDVQLAGGDVLTGHGVFGVAERLGSVSLETRGGDLEAGSVIACAGLYADRVAQLTGATADPKIVPFRGDYWLLRPERSYLARNLIYPVPDPAFPFLGVHFTRRMADAAVWLGPNAALAFSREGYSRLAVRPVDVVDTLAHPGFRKLAAHYWRNGLEELIRDFSKQAFLRSLQLYVPELVLNDLLPGPSGVRAQALDADGRLVDDFLVDATASGRVLHVRNAPSPAATSSLAIGRLVADRATAVFGGLSAARRQGASPHRPRSS